MDLRSVPDIIRAFRSFSRRLSTTLSFCDKSGLIDVPGDCNNLYLWDRIDRTSHALVRQTSIGHVQLSLNLPSLKQSRIERSVMFESTNAKVAVNDSRSLTDLTAFGVHCTFRWFFQAKNDDVKFTFGL